MTPLDFIEKITPILEILEMKIPQSLKSLIYLFKGWSFCLVGGAITILKNDGVRQWKG
jgi:hypothetical protein